MANVPLAKLISEVEQTRRLVDACWRVCNTLHDRINEVLAHLEPEEGREDLVAALDGLINALEQRLDPNQQPKAPF